VFVVAVVVPCVRHQRVPFEHVFAFVTFFFGTAVYRHYQGVISTSQLRRLTAATLGLALLGTICNYYLFTNSSEHVTAEASAFTYIGAFTGFFLAYTNRFRTFPRFLLFLGTISYSMYLLHPLVIELCVDRFGEFARFLVGLPVTILLSTLTYKFLEVPMVACGHRLAKRYQAPRALPEAPTSETELKASA
jgi:peptidoglycan/LPS O-acetylase OafA/YrhL